MNRFRIGVSLAVLALCSTATWAQTYTYYPLSISSPYPNPPANATAALDINNVGEIVGYSGGNGSPELPLKWSVSLPVTPPLIATFLGMLSNGTQSGRATSISQLDSNSVSHIVGNSLVGSGKNGDFAPCIWQSGNTGTPTMLALNSFASSTYCVTTGVNKSANVSGIGDDAFYGSLPTIWTSSSGFTPVSYHNPTLPSSEGSRSFYSINEANHAVGGHLGVIGSTQFQRPVLYIWTPPVPPSTPGFYTINDLCGEFETGDAFDISNNTGTNYAVVGRVGPDPTPSGIPIVHGFYYDVSTGVRYDLAPFNIDNSSTAYGVNDVGDAVGYSENVGGTRNAVVWINKGSAIDLNAAAGSTLPSGVHLLEAYAINDSGDIVGVAGSPGNTTAFYLKRNP